MEGEQQYHPLRREPTKRAQRLREMDSLTIIHM